MGNECCGGSGTPSSEVSSPPSQSNEAAASSLQRNERIRLRSSCATVSGIMVLTSKPTVITARGHGDIAKENVVDGELCIEECSMAHISLGEERQSNYLSPSDLVASTNPLSLMSQEGKRLASSNSPVHGKLPAVTCTEQASLCSDAMAPNGRPKSVGGTILPSDEAEFTNTIGLPAILQTSDVAERTRSIRTRTDEFFPVVVKNSSRGGELSPIPSTSQECARPLTITTDFDRSLDESWMRQRPAEILGQPSIAQYGDTFRHLERHCSPHTADMSTTATSQLSSCTAVERSQQLPNYPTSIALAQMPLPIASSWALA